MQKYTLLPLLFLLVSWMDVAAQVPQPVKQLGRSSAMKGASYAVLIKEVGTGAALVSFESDRLLAPASVLKTLTTATALEVLGADFRYETYLEYTGRIANGELDGDLYIRGSGDPTLGSSSLTADKDSVLLLWTQAIKAKGIRKIKGAVIVDEMVFDSEGISEKWLREDLGNYYAAGSYGVSVFDNTYTLTFRSFDSGTKPEIVSQVPAIKGMTFENNLQTLPVRTDSVYIFGAPFSGERALYGVVPIRKERIRVKGDIPHPPLYLAQYMTDLLSRQGVQVSNVPTTVGMRAEATDQKNRTLLLTTYSPTLSEIVRITNFESHNLYADALLKTIGVCLDDGRGQAHSSFRKGVEAMGRFWETKGIRLSSDYLFDGSGLSPSNKIPASLLADIYSYMATRSASADDFYQSLPVVGKDGTVRYFMQGSKLQGKARLKSGTMSGVRCYGGYLDHQGKRYAVVVMVNNFTGKSIALRKSIEQMLLSLF